MSLIAALRARLRLLLFGRAAESRMDEEFRFHVEMETEKNIRAGCSPAEARRRALVSFGGVEGHRELMRDGRGARWLNDAARDARYAARMLAGSPGFAAVAIMTLALGIGANTAIFSVVDGVLLRPLPYEEPQRLVALTDLGYRGELLELRERSRTLELEAVGVGREFNLTGAGEPARLEGATVTAGAFRLVGLAPAHGRSFLEGEDRAGAEPVVVLSHGLWQRRFGADPGVLGQRIRLDGVERTVVGIMPAGTLFPSSRTELWVPLRLDAADPVSLWSMSAGTLIGRLRSGVSLEAARAEVSRLAPEMRELFPWDMPESYGVTATAVPLREFMVGDVRPTLLILLVAVGLVLLIACVNVANLLLARATSRSHETALRSALGATRGRLLRQHLTESVLLAGLGALAGVALAYGGVSALLGALPSDTPRFDEIAINGRVLAFTLVTTVAAGIGLGVIPALLAAGRAPRSALAHGGRGGAGGPGRRRIAGALVVAEIGLAVVLVVGSALVLKGFWRLADTDTGLEARNVVAATLAPPEFRYATPESRGELHARLAERIAGLPGVDAAALGSAVPFGGRAYGSVFVIEGRPHPARSGGEWPWADVRVAVSDDYFRLLGIRLLRGRGFRPSDRADAPGVAVIGRTLAEQYWPDEDPIGRAFSFPGGARSFEVVGVVEDVKWERLGEAAPGAMYMPLRQVSSEGPISALLRTGRSPAGLAAELRAVVASVDDATPVAEVRALDELVARSVQQPRLTMAILVLFAALALALGTIGIYGVVAYAVGQRTREFGVRIALGARPRTVLGEVVREGARLAAVGVALGILSALALTRFLSSQLYGVSATDPVVFLTVPAVLTVIAVLASWLPARRAARVDPSVVLRAQ